MNPAPSTFRLLHLIVAALVFAGLGAGGWYAYARSKSSSHGEGGRDGAAKGGGAIAVEVVHPKAGGIVRTCTQPGTVEPFESADLFAKVSGYLAEQAVERGGKKVAVDIGTRVKAGEVLVRISVPEYEKAVERDQARVRDSVAKVKQSEAHVRAAQAEARAADAAVKLARAQVKAKTAYRHYREKQLERIKGLYEQKAIDAKLMDEQEDFYQSALAAEDAANEQVATAREKAAATRAKIEQAEADVDEAKADVGVAEADLGRSKVLLDYTIIKSPYSGVVTRRSFHAGDFIKAADQGGTTPMLAVERTDVMRVVVQVPDRDVPFVSAGDPAVVEIDALPGVVFETKGESTIGVSRWADAEDPATRTMRTEIDVPNPDGKLRHGMYGRVTILLDQGLKTAVRVPSAALSGKAEGGRGKVQVVRDGKARAVPVRFAADNGIEAEIVSGLTPDDVVIVRATAPVDDGTPVTVQEQRAAAGGH
ncbi:MAG TPA: efflux RND transporter periplasmic adaptor subunit [Urbifossiella sp.]|jgi:RND family efflux transporter MFP subunit|nr:efflux RND transporter periplasmic adaptor subunit [Urbifossiella sp.]